MHTSGLSQKLLSTLKWTYLLSCKTVLLPILRYHACLAPPLKAVWTLHISLATLQQMGGKTIISKVLSKSCIVVGLQESHLPRLFCADELSDLHGRRVRISKHKGPISRAVFHSFRPSLILLLVPLSRQHMYKNCSIVSWHEWAGHVTRPVWLALQPTYSLLSRFLCVSRSSQHLAFPVRLKLSFQLDLSNRSVLHVTSWSVLIRRSYNGRPWIRALGNKALNRTTESWKWRRCKYIDSSSCLCTHLLSFYLSRHWQLSWKAESNGYHDDRIAQWKLMTAKTFSLHLSSEKD